MNKLDGKFEAWLVIVLEYNFVIYTVNKLWVRMGTVKILNVI